MQPLRVRAVYRPARYLSGCASARAVLQVAALDAVRLSGWDGVAMADLRAASIRLTRALFHCASPSTLPSLTLNTRAMRPQPAAKSRSLRETLCGHAGLIGAVCHCISALGRDAASVTPLYLGRGMCRAVRNPCGYFDIGCGQARIQTTAAVT